VISGDDDAVGYGAEDAAGPAGDLVIASLAGDDLDANGKKFKATMVAYVNNDG
jgi:hypothetical protein